MRVILGGIVKNVEAFFGSIADFILRLKQSIPELEVCLYENNSTDQTKMLLEQISSDFIQVVCEDISKDYFLESGRARTWDNLPCRIQMIAHARNKLLDMIAQKNLGAGDFVIMADLDFAKSPDVAAIAAVIKQFPSQVDAFFANGVSPNGEYYDAFVLRTATHPFGPEIIGEEFWSREHMEKLQRRIPADAAPQPVFSAFGGMGIYRADAISGCRYSYEITDDVHALYSQLGAAEITQKALVSGGREAMTHYKGALQGCFLKNDKIFYRNNSGYAWPIIGEHVAFHAQMIALGRSNMYILPQLYYYYP